MGRLLDIAQRTGTEPGAGTYRVNGVYRVGQTEEKGPPQNIAESDYAINAVNAERVEGKSLKAMNADLALLHDRIIQARCQHPKKGTHADAVTWLQGQVAKLAARSIGVSGTKDGWDDPADAYAYSDQISGLRHGLAEVKQGPYPMPLPEGCTLLPQANFDVFAAGRLYNGGVSGTGGAG